MTGVSGCIGSVKSDPDPITTPSEAAGAVEDIAAGVVIDEEPDPMAVATVRLSVCCNALRQRVRLLTWAVVLLAVCVVAREMK